MAGICSKHQGYDPNCRLCNPRVDWVYVLDPLEHGNGGTYGIDVLAYLPLSKALGLKPRNLGVYSKEWGFWPVISSTSDNTDTPLYRWDDDTETWEKESA